MPASGVDTQETAVEEDPTVVVFLLHWGTLLSHATHASLIFTFPCVAGRRAQCPVLHNFRKTNTGKNAFHLGVFPLLWRKTVDGGRKGAEGDRQRGEGENGAEAAAQHPRQHGDCPGAASVR